MSVLAMNVATAGLLRPTPTLAPVVVAVARGGSEAAVRFGAGEALRTGRPLDLVHVAPTADGWSRQLGHDSLWIASEQARPLVGPGLGVRVELLSGDAQSELVRVARTSALLVMERRSPGVRRWAGSSTTAGVADGTDVAVVAVPTDWFEAGRGIVTVGVDPLVSDDRALRSAMVLARIRRAVLRVVVAGPGGTASAAVRLRADVEARLDRLGGDACDTAVEIAHDPADEALLTASGTSDVLVLGRHRPTPHHEAPTGAGRAGGAGACPLPSPAHPARPRARGGADRPAESGVTTPTR